MTKNTNFVSHKKSKQKVGNKPQLPLAESLVEGEIAINFAEGVETLSIKNDSGDVVTFSSDNYYSEKKLGSAFTGANSAVTVTDVIGENEEIIAAALTDLNERKLDASAYTPSEGGVWVSGTGLNSVVQKGSSGTASGDYAVSEGFKTVANEWAAHAEGTSTSATSYQAHAEGYNTLASASDAHAEGSTTIAQGGSSHAEGQNTSGTGIASHAEGRSSLAAGNYSHSEGFFTVANNAYEHASGKYNVSSMSTDVFGNSGNTLFSVGNGNESTRHNAFEVRQNGDIYIVNKNGQDVRLQDEIGNIDIDQVIDSGTSASTDAVSTSAVYGFVTSYTPSITVDQDFTNTASTNPISTKAVYSAITDNELVVSTALNDLKTNKFDASAITSYSSATEVNTALAGKSSTGHVHAADAVTAMTGYVASSTVSDISTSDTLNQAMGKLEARFGGIRIVTISQTDYDNLPTPRDSSILYVITD